MAKVRNARLQELLKALAAEGKATVELSKPALDALAAHLRDNPDDRPPGARRVWDAKQTGLHLRVMPSGAMSFNVQYSRKGTKSLGQYPTTTLDGARRRAAEAIADANRSADGIPSIARPAPVAAKLTLEQFIEREYRPHARKHLDHGDQAADRILQIMEGHKRKPLAAITLPMVQKAIDSRGVSPATMARDRNALRAAFNLAIKWGLIEKNPAVGLDLGKAKEETAPRYLDAAEEKRLLEALAARDQAMRDARARTLAGARVQHARLVPIGPDEFPDHLTPLVLTALHTGCRRGELFKLRWADVDLTSRHPQLTVRASTAKSGKTRHVPLNATAVAALKQWRKQHPEAIRVFGLVDVKKAWAALLKAAEIRDFRFHDLRHTFASKLVQRGVPLNTVRELLGHADIKMTLRYAHLAPENKAAAVALLDRPAGDDNVIQFPARAG